METTITLIIWGALTLAGCWIVHKYINPWAMQRRIRKQERQWEREADALVWQHRVKTQRLRDRGF